MNKEKSVQVSDTTMMRKEIMLVTKKLIAEQGAIISEKNLSISSNSL